MEGIMNESEDGGKSEVDESGFAGTVFESEEHTHFRAGAVAEIHNAKIKPRCDFSYFITGLLCPFWTTRIIKYHGWFTIQPAFFLGNRCCNLLLFSNLVQHNGFIGVDVLTLPNQADGFAPELMTKFIGFRKGPAF